MIIEAYKDEVDDEDTGIRWRELIMLSISTSIDAFAVGVSFGTMGDRMRFSISLAAVIIGCITFVISLGGVIIGNYFGAKYKSRAEIAGGVILIIIGIKVLMEHYI